MVDVEKWAAKNAAAGDLAEIKQVMSEFAAEVLRRAVSILRV